MTTATVIIPTRDRADALARCLESLTHQTLSPGAFEVIVVDNGSSDGTRAVTARYAGRLNLRRIWAPEPGLHVGRHEGYRAATSSILMYADDDIEAEPSWIEAVVDAFSDPAVALVGGNNVPRFETPPPDWLVLWWSRRVYRGQALPYLSILDFGTGRFALDPHYIWGCNFSVRRELVSAARGFHPDALPRDWIKMRGDGETHVAKFIERRGLVALFDSRATVHHFVPTQRMTREYLCQRGYAQGISDSYSAVRSAGRPSPPATQRVRAWLRPALTSVRERWRARSDRGPASRTLLEVQLAAIRAWREGYAFHQAAVRRDHSLLEWVLKESYL